MESQKRPGNTLVREYRKQVTNDPHSDDQLTMLLGQKHDADGSFSDVPDFVADYQRLKAAQQPAQEQPIWGPGEMPLGVELRNRWNREDVGIVLVVDCAVAGTGFGVSCLVLWVPTMWRKTLKETNQLSRAVQGKLDDSPDDRNRGAGSDSVFGSVCLSNRHENRAVTQT